MKKVFILTSFIFVSLSSFCQMTYEEWDLIKFGDYGVSPHQNAIERRELNEWNINNGLVKINMMIRKQDKKLIAYEMIRTLKEQNEFKCLIIPSHSNNDKILSEYWKTINELDKETKNLFLYYIVFYLGFD